ncbi:MAG: class I SAM-dependent rRNA methyltransferase [Bacteroidales bacterium]|nr:class I SAM-dependent rRNA methyltransferase [Bacteroidales bacterium]
MEEPRYPVIKLKRGKDEAVRRFHPWVFSGAIDSAAQGLQAGDIVTVVDADDNILGTGFCESGSIAVKLLSFDNRKIGAMFWQERLGRCFEMRRSLGFPNENTDCYRLVHSEGDHLPGLIVDIYGKTAVIQAQTEGMALNIKNISEALQSVPGLDVEAVYNKSSEAMQRMGKDAIDDGYIFGESVTKIVTENGSKFNVDWETGQKTGFFLDQRDNRELVRRLAHDRDVLNTFSYTGGFSVTALRGGARRCVSVDSSRKAMDVCANNLTLNGFDVESNPCVCQDAKEYLTNLEKDEFDLIILDPPAFVKNHKNLHHGLQGYKFINYEALLKLRHGGFLFTFSCSQAVDIVQFQSVVMAAAIEAGRDAHILYRLSQPADHPVNIFHPEGSYLKGLVLKVD